MKFIRIKAICFYLLLCILSLCRPCFAEDENEYLSVTGPCNLEFPKDHRDHPGYRTEWWYYTGNLRSENGDHYGFQLTFFRSQISPPGADRKWPRHPSAWRTQQVFLGHAAVSDITGKNHLVAEEVSRAALGMAGVTHSFRHTMVFLKTWSAEIEADTHNLKVNTDDFFYDLTLKAVKPPVLHGDRGYSRKGSTPGRASCYYSITRFDAQGSIRIGEMTVMVTGLAWMDHEFSTEVLEPGIIGWDWFSLQLSDETEVMVFLLRTEQGGLHTASSGTYVDVDGITRHLANTEFNVRVLDTWKSKHSGVRYPARWRLQVVPLAIDVNIVSRLPDQEMRTLRSTGVRYWEGSVSIDGTKNKQPVDGKGYVELTGYGDAFDAPL